MVENHLPRGYDLAQQENNGFGPIFKRRGKTATLASAIVFVITGAMLFFAVKENSGLHSPVFTIALHTLIFVPGEMIRRLSLVSEELKHRRTRYQGKWKNVFKATFCNDYCKRSLVAVIVSAFIVCRYQYEVFFSPVSIILFFLNSLLVDQWSSLVGLRELSPVERWDLLEQIRTGGAEGLAWSYYFAYLKLVLPKLRHRIAESDTFGHLIADEKLYILVPKTCYTFGEISKADDRVKWAGKLPASNINWAGILERKYQHAVYRIEMPRPDGTVEEYHFVLEYAMPLMSLFEMSGHAEKPLSGLARDHEVNTCDLLCDFRYDKKYFS